jgi:hypothetical protein
MNAVVFVAAGVLLTAATWPRAAGAAPPQRPAERKPDTFLSGRPFNFNDLKAAIGVIYEGRLKEAIEARGIGFAPTASELEQLRKAGASPDILQLIRQKAQASQRLPSSQVPATGTLALQCAPAECDILLNGIAAGRTQNGSFEMKHGPGQVVIDFTKSGYEGQQLVISLRAGARAATSVALSPTHQMEVQIGRSVFAKMLDRFGGSGGLTSAVTIAAAGNARLWQAGGQRTDWEALARLKISSNMALIELSGAGLRWWTSVRGSDSKSDGSGKLKGGPVAFEMEKLVRLFRDFQPAALIGRIQAQAMELSSKSAAPDHSGQILLRSASATEAYVFSLDRDATPKRVVYESTSGLGSGLEVTYADYGPLGETIYPRTIAFRFPDQAQHGIELRFDEVRAVAKLSDREFHR